MAVSSDVTKPVGRVDPVDIKSEVSRSYLDYAMSVIVGRALPDVRDGLKPVHRRVLYSMFEGGYRPDRGFSKCARVVGDVMGNYHPHGDSAIYDALVRLAQPWVLRYPLVDGQGNFGSPGNDAPAAMRYTESRMSALAIEMVRDIDEDTVSFVDNYDGRTQEPTILPSRFPNLLVNGSNGIAVGMATNIPPHNLREVAEAAQWVLDNPDADAETTVTALLSIISGPDFPTGALILGRKGVEEAYRTGRGAITMRAVVEVDQDTKGRNTLVITQLPYQVNPDNLKVRIAEHVDSGRIQGIADIRDDSSARTGMRIVIVLKKDAVPQVVLNNLYKHTQLQETFGANMLALVDGVPRTLTLDALVREWVLHQIEVIQRRTTYRLNEAQKRVHILNGYLAALDALDEVIALIRASATADIAKESLKEMLTIDDLQATAILEMQLRRLAALERQKIIDEHAEVTAAIKDYQDILAKDSRQRKIVSSELKEIVDRFGDERKTQIVPMEEQVADQDLIAQENIVITITRTGYIKRTKSDAYRAQKRGGKGVRGANLREDDVVEHLLVANTHDWVLFFTNLGRVYRLHAYEVGEGGRDARGQHVANLLAFKANETIAQIVSIRDYSVAKYLVLATARGVVKKTPLIEFDSTRSGGVQAIRLRDGDSVIAARLVSPKDELLMVSKSARSVRFGADDQTLRPMARAAGGVIGMRFRDTKDCALSLEVVRPKASLVTVTNEGFAKRTELSEWLSKGRGGLGVRAMRLTDDRGELAGAVVAEPHEELFAIASNGVVLRTKVSEIRATGSDTMGVAFMDLRGDEKVVAVALSGIPEV
ncbi:MAG: DNA gyrase subunit A [Actinobacteria bacterium]|nr:DNA gyrase subunit A [Actinomycetota bacterium]